MQHTSYKSHKLSLSKARRTGLHLKCSTSQLFQNQLLTDCASCFVEIEKFYSLFIFAFYFRLSLTLLLSFFLFSCIRSIFFFFPLFILSLPLSPSSSRSPTTKVTSGKSKKDSFSFIQSKRDFLFGYVVVSDLLCFFEKIEREKESDLSTGLSD